MPLRRLSHQPLVTPADIPALRRDMTAVSGVFNPGAVSWRGRELLLLRVQTRGRTTLLVPAEVHDDDVEILGPPIDIHGVDRLDPAPVHVYDPRLTVVDDTLYAVLACDFPVACHLLIARTEDFARWEMVGLDDIAVARNGVLFPQRVEGEFLQLRRPNTTLATGPASGDHIELVRSPDLVTWSEPTEVFRGRPQRWDELIGSGPPPVKTTEGWLHIYHGVATHFAASNLYQAGVVLLDLTDPSRVIARGAFNILEPCEPWELTGQVPNVVFPSGMVVETHDDQGFARPDSPVRVYYGAADTVIGMATSTIQELIDDARFAG